MYKTSSELKGQVRKALKGQWKSVILLNIVPSLAKMINIWIIVYFISLGISTTLNYMNLWGNSDKPIESDTSFSKSGDWDSVVITSESYSWKPADNEGSGHGENTETSDGESLTDFSNGTDLATTMSLFNLKVAKVILISLGSWVLSMIASFMAVGIMFTLIDFIRKPRHKIKPLKGQFRVFNGKDFISIVLIQLLMGIFVYLWSLLFAIPGIVKSYSYSQALNIYKDHSENPESEGLSISGYITESKVLMEGHRMRLFLVNLSFIGWDLLAMLTLGIGYLFVEPYRAGTMAAFYSDIAQNRYLPEEVVSKKRRKRQRTKKQEEWMNH